jgi:ribosome-binding protein aMBF1 (putative translation factor)
MATRRASQKRDFLDQMIAQREARSPGFGKRVDAALHRRELLRALAKTRREIGLSQDDVATKMDTSQPAIAKIESGEVDVRTSTLERFAGALGGHIEYRFVPGSKARAKELKAAFA